MSRLDERDLGTPAVVERYRQRHHRRQGGRRPRRHVRAPRRDRGRRRDPQALRDRLAQGVRLLPDVPGRGRRRQGRARVLHHPLRRRHGRPHDDRPGPGTAPQRDGALPLRPPGGLRRLRPRQLRDPGDGRAPSTPPRSATDAPRAARTSRTRPPSTSATPTSPSTRPPASSARAASAPAPRPRAPSRSPSRAVASTRAISAGGTDFFSSECVSCGACVQACPTSALQEHSVVQLGMPTRSVETTCAYCGVGCSFRAEVQGDGADSRVVRMVPSKNGGANEGHSCVKGRFAYGYAAHQDRQLHPMVRDTIDDEWRAVSWEEAIAKVATGFQALQAEHGVGRHRRHLLQSLHQRGGLRRPEDGAGGLRQQQHRHLRAGLPLPHRLRPEADVRHLRRHPGLPLGREVRRDLADRGQPHRRAPRLRLADEAPPPRRAPA